MISASANIRGINLFRIFHEELGMARVCQLLEVHATTVRAWLREKHPVPRMAVLALYWETSYGKSLIDVDQVNEIRLLYRRVCILQEQFDRAREIVNRLRRLNTGTANDAFFDDLKTFDSLPFDSYGAMTNATEMLRQHAASDVQRQSVDVATPKSRISGQQSRAAQAAFATFDKLRQASAG